MQIESGPLCSGFMAERASVNVTERKLAGFASVIFWWSRWQWACAKRGRNVIEVGGRRFFWYVHAEARVRIATDDKRFVVAYRWDGEWCWSGEQRGFGQAGAAAVEQFKQHYRKRPTISYRYSPDALAMARTHSQAVR